MKRNLTSTVFVALLSLTVIISSCSSYRQVQGAATGASLGGMFGSSIGRLMGGPRGGDKGTVAGMLIGGAIGAAASSSTQKTRRPSHNDSQNQSSPSDYGYSSSDEIYTMPSSGNKNGVAYGSYKTMNSDVTYANTSDLQSLEVTNVRFLDENDNRRIDLNEKAYLVFDIYNRGDKALYNVSPNILCSSKRIVISAATSVECVQPGQGIRYKAAVVAVRKIGATTPLTFTISFGQGKQQVVARTFSL